MLDMVQYIGSIGGIAGVLSFLIFLAYRHSVNQMRNDRRFMEDRLDKIISAYNVATSENTKVLAELFTYLKMRNGVH